MGGLPGLTTHVPKGPPNPQTLTRPFEQIARSPLCQLQTSHTDDSTRFPEPRFDSNTFDTSQTFTCPDLRAAPVYLGSRFPIPLNSKRPSSLNRDKQPHLLPPPLDQSSSHHTQVKMVRPKKQAILSRGFRENHRLRNPGALAVVPPTPPGGRRSPLVLWTVRLTKRGTSLSRRRKLSNSDVATPNSPRSRKPAWASLATRSRSAKRASRSRPSLPSGSVREHNNPVNLRALGPPRVRH